MTTDLRLLNCSDECGRRERRTGGGAAHEPASSNDTTGSPSSAENLDVRADGADCHLKSGARCMCRVVVTGMAMGREDAGVAGTVRQDE
jgi:hypothetical protein